MNEIIEAFRKELLEIMTFKDNTVKIYINIIYKYFVFAKENLKVEPLKTTAFHLRKWFTYLKKKKTGSSGLKNCRAALRHFFSFLFRRNIISSNPAENLPRVRKTRSNLNKPVSKKSVIKLLKSFDRTTCERNYIIVSILWSSLGLRVNELVTLKLKDLNLDYDPEHKTGLLLIHGKGRKERKLFIVDKLYTELQHYLNHPKSPKHKNQPLFLNRSKTSLSVRRVEQIITEAVSKADIYERITPHVLRHTFATEMYINDVPLKAIKDMLGHENIAETSLYVHIPDTLKQNILEKLSVKRSAS